MAKSKFLFYTANDPFPGNSRNLIVLNSFTEGTLHMKPDFT